jgi:hypothetical protein
MNTADGALVQRKATPVLNELSSTGDTDRR